MNEFTLEKFTQPTSKGMESYISLGKKTFGLSANFLMENALTNMTRVVLYYDKEQRLIAFKFLASKNNEEYSLKMMKSGQSARSKTINASRFYLHYDIDPKVHRGRYSPHSTTLPNLGLVYYIKLKESESKNKK